jgi:hypothetical protein
MVVGSKHKMLDKMTLLAINQGDGSGDHKPITGPVDTFEINIREIQCVTLTLIYIL